MSANVSLGMGFLAAGRTKMVALKRKFLTFDGSSYAKFSEISCAGDFDITLKYTAWYDWFTLALLGQTGSLSNLLQISSDDILTVRINGVYIDGVLGNNSWANGKQHTVRVARSAGIVTLYFDGSVVATAENSGTFKLSEIAARNSASMWRGTISDVSIDNAGDITAWSIDSGSDTTEQAAIGDNDLTYINVASGDWEALTLDADTGSWLGMDLWADDYSTGIGNWIPASNNLIINDGGALKFTAVDHSNAGEVYADSSGDLIADLVSRNRYLVSCEAKQTLVGITPRLRWGDNAYITSSDWMTLSACKVATAATGLKIDIIDFNSSGEIWARRFAMRRIIEPA